MYVCLQSVVANIFYIWCCWLVAHKSTCEQIHNAFGLQSLFLRRKQCAGLALLQLFTIPASFPVLWFGYATYLAYTRLPVLSIIHH